MITLGKYGVCLAALVLIVPVAALLVGPQTAEQVAAQPVAPSALAAPATQPDSDATPATQPGSRRGNFGRGGGPGQLWNRLFNGPGSGGAAGPHSTASERDEAAAFIHEHSSNRAKLLDMMRPATRELVLNTFVVSRYRQMSRFQNSDPELYKVLVEQFEAQDQVLGDMEQLSHSEAAATTEPTTSPSAAQTAASVALHDEIAKLVDLNLQQRQARLARLRETISREEDRLARDMDRRDVLVDNAYRRALDDADRLAKRMNSMNGSPSTQPADGAGPTADQSAPASPNAGDRAAEGAGNTAADTATPNSPPHP
jgi:hypothetical protein